MYDKFWEKVQKTDTCWNWKAYKCKLGYGQFRYKKKSYKAHRFMWTIVNGELDSNLKVLHKCDNRKCVNPDHLFLGTQIDNIYDMIRKGRANSGGIQKIDYNIAKQIRHLYNRKTCNQYKLAEMFNISQSNVSYILKNKRWGQVYEEK